VTAVVGARYAAFVPGDLWHRSYSIVSFVSLPAGSALNRDLSSTGRNRIAGEECFDWSTLLTLKMKSNSQHFRIYNVGEEQGRFQHSEVTEKAADIRAA
jgi:hypothetical protein